MSARFVPGDRVAVRRFESPGHIRTPYYVRGRTGVVERVYGASANPEELAYGRYESPTRQLYRVRFELTQVWPDYDGPPSDRLEVEILEHWLEPCCAARADP